MRGQFGEKAFEPFESFLEFFEVRQSSQQTGGRLFEVLLEVAKNAKNLEFDFLIEFQVENGKRVDLVATEPGELRIDNFEV